MVEYLENRPAEFSNSLLIQNFIESEPTLACDVTIALNQNSDNYQKHFKDTDVRVVAKDATKSSIEQNCHLAIGYDLTSNDNPEIILKNLKNSIKEEGFILLEENIFGFNNQRSVLKNLNLIVISEQVLENRILVLLRQSSDLNNRKKKIIRLTDKNFNWIEDLKESLIASETGAYTYIVCNEELSGAVGLTNCIKDESGGKMVRLFLTLDKNFEQFDFESESFKEQLKKDLVQNVLKNGKWGSFRHLKLDGNIGMPMLLVEHAYINALTKGDLSSLQWIEGNSGLAENKDPSVDLCKVYYAPINFRDVMLSSGKLAADALPGDLAQQDCVLGLEFSGRDSSGRRIMAMVQAKSLATVCEAKKNMMWEIPENWTSK